MRQKPSNRDVTIARIVMAAAGAILWVTGIVLFVLACIGILQDLWGFAGLVALVPAVVMLAVAYVGPTGREGRHNLWAIFGMGGATDPKPDPTRGHFPPVSTLQANKP
jgi:hypothetical protein